MTAISIASLVSLTIGGTCFQALRKLTLRRATAEDLDAWLGSGCHRTPPLERLLDPVEFACMRARGFSRERIRRLRSRRRALFRMYLRQITEEFNTAHDSLQVVLVSAGADRPDLARELSRQRLLFYRGLIGVELRLAFHALGFDAAPSLELLGPLEHLRMEFCRLVPSAAA